ncbi:hypothetical protein SD427_14505 [Chryseobacterium sp. JJR-5R]|uniref:hypothetical protein n=1 Tax=Chryseobacterium sp. JJR-5R TaxID=3093923 RepID=UPI002A760B40|nr:hypothetical protein [Chryseobacterium sp. JJR-5R]WPO81969.1 hypothetical protein SD427_14505 [Chryseobacterium sp. JJR-5R]
MRISILLILIVFLNSCKKEEYTTEEKKQGNIVQKIIYNHGKITVSKTYESGILNTELIYDNGVIVKMYQYYSDRKTRSYSYLTKKPNHYVTKFYHKNKKTASEGEGDYFKDKNLYLRRGTWIFYNNTGEPYSIYTFGHDGKNEYIQDEVIFDTVKNKIIKEVKFDPPILFEKEIK